MRNLGDFHPESVFTSWIKIPSIHPEDLAAFHPITASDSPKDCENSKKIQRKTAFWLFIYFSRGDESRFLRHIPKKQDKMSSAPKKIADLIQRCKVLSEELRFADLYHQGTNTPELAIDSGGKRQEIITKRNDKIQQIFDRRTLTTRGKSNRQESSRNRGLKTKRLRQHQPDVVFPLLPEEKYKNVRPLPKPQKISLVTQNISKNIARAETQIKQINKIKLLQINAHGALTSHKLSYLKELISVHKPEMILVNEFGQPKDTPVFPKIETYRAMSYDLKAAFSGVAIYVQAALQKQKTTMREENARSKNRRKMKWLQRRRWKTPSNFIKSHRYSI